MQQEQLASAVSPLPLRRIDMCGGGARFSAPPPVALSAGDSGARRAYALRSNRS
jgi:hypothetical protein